MLFVQNALSLAVGIALVVISIMFGWIGNILFIQSSAKYNHDVEEMRKTILGATACISGTAMVSGSFFLVSFAISGNLVDMTDNMFMFGDNVLAIYYSFDVLFGYVALEIGVIVAIYYRVVSGWDRIYLLPLALPEIEAEMLKQL